jgi:hypothetical protein
MSWHSDFKEDFSKVSDEYMYGLIEDLISDFSHIFKKRTNILITLGDGQNERCIRFQIKKSVTIEAPTPLVKTPYPESDLTSDYEDGNYICK